MGFPLGFERALRGSSAGDRTFALVSAGAAAVTATVGPRSPQAIAGIITGIGFIGAGVVLQSSGMVKGVTTAAAIFATAAIGIVAGSGHLLLALLVTALVLVVLEMPYLPGLRLIDARRYQHMTMDDDDPPTGMDQGVT